MQQESVFAQSYEGCPFSLKVYTAAEYPPVQGMHAHKAGGCVPKGQDNRWWLLLPGVQLGTGCK